MFGTARGSPASRKVVDIELRSERLQKLEREFKLIPYEFEELVGQEAWQSYWLRLAEIEQLMRDAQAEAEKLKLQIKLALEGPAASD